jgi:hypothetical protein
MTLTDKSISAIYTWQTSAPRQTGLSMLHSGIQLCILLVIQRQSVSTRNKVANEGTGISQCLTETICVVSSKKTWEGLVAVPNRFHSYGSLTPVGTTTNLSGTQS